MAKKKTYMDRTLSNMKGWNGIQNSDDKARRKATGKNAPPAPVSKTTSKILKDKASSAKPATPHSGGPKMMKRTIRRKK